MAGIWDFNRWVQVEQMLKTGNPLYKVSFQHHFLFYLKKKAFIDSSVEWLFRSEDEQQHVFWALSPLYFEVIGWAVSLHSTSPGGVWSKALIMQVLKYELCWISFFGLLISLHPKFVFMSRKIKDFVMMGFGFLFLFFLFFVFCTGLRIITQVTLAITGQKTNTFFKAIEN